MMLTEANPNRAFLPLLFEPDFITEAVFILLEHICLVYVIERETVVLGNFACCLCSFCIKSYLVILFSRNSKHYMSLVLVHTEYRFIFFFISYPIIKFYIFSESIYCHITVFITATIL